jgi:hypothetical protein
MLRRRRRLGKLQLESERAASILLIGLFAKLWCCLDRKDAKEGTTQSEVRSNERWGLAGVFPINCQRALVTIQMNIHSLLIAGPCASRLADRVRV